MSYIPKKNKLVLALSFMHSNDDVDCVDPGEAKKPKIILFYNWLKVSVDVVDELKTTYLLSRISNCWLMTVFYSLVNIEGINPVDSLF